MMNVVDELKPSILFHACIYCLDLKIKNRRVFLCPNCLVANDLRRVAFLVRFKVDSECDAAPVGGGKGGELGSVAIFL